MRALIWFLLLAALAAALAMVTRYSDGYAMLVYPPYRIELSLPVLFAGLILAFFILHWALRALAHTLRLPSYVAAFRRRRRESRGHTALRQAWEAFLEGRFGRAQKLSARAFAMQAAPSISALLAARSAHAMHDFSKRDEWLERAADIPGESRRARLSTRAEMLMDERRYDEARAILHDLHDRGAKHVATLRLMLRAEQGAKNWEEVLRLLRILEKRDAFTRLSSAQMRTDALIEMLKAKALNAEALRELWKRMSTQERRDPRIAAIAAQLFIGLGGCKEAHRLITEALNQSWTPELVLLYGECRDEDALARIQQAETWLKSHPNDAALLLTLGRLCLYRELWGKARSYLEASLTQKPSRTVHRELARLCEQLGDVSQANQHYRQAADEGLAA